MVDPSTLPIVPCAVKLFVIVKPGSKKPGIEKTDAENWIVRVRAPATEGKANRAVIEAVARELGLPKSRIELLRGAKSRQKTLMIQS